MKKIIYLVGFMLLAPLLTNASTLYSQDVELATGWNIVSTPKILDSHAFSTAENSTNFDIYVLDPSETSGWATMADLGQTEFAPLYGYFINNKTGSTQTLTFNYKAGVEPNERLFSREFTSTGWHSIGIANPTYGKSVGASSIDSNNPSDILFSLGEGYSSVIDFTVNSFSTNPDSTSIGNTWSAYTRPDANNSNDFRETKAYAVYISTAGTLYTGLQNNSIPQCSDGNDNDSDGQIDLDDFGCASSLDNDEFNDLPEIAISTSASPAAQAVVGGAQDFTFATYQFDTTGSGEDIRFTSLSLDYNFGGTDTYLTNCQLWDGATVLNTGSNLINPDITNSGDPVIFTLDGSGLVIPKETTKNISLKCDVSSSVTSADTFSWDIDNSQSGTGTTSGSTVNVTGVGSGAVMTGANAGTLSVSLDPSSPAYKMAAAGATNVLAGVYKFAATNEAVDVNRVSITLSGTSNISTPDSITLITLKNSAGITIGTTAFSGSSRFATSTLTSDFVVPNGGDSRMYIYLDLSNIGASEAINYSGSLIKVDYNGNDSTGTQGVGVASGTTINATGSTTSVAGVRVMDSIPTFAKNTSLSTTLANGTERALLRFSVTASSEDMAVAKFTVGVATTGINLSNINIHAFEDSSFSSPVSGHSPNGQLDDTDKTSTSTGGDLEIYAENSSGTTVGALIPASMTRYFEVRGDISSASTGDSVTITLQGDSAYPNVISTLMGNVSEIESDSNNDLIWSPYSLISSSASDQDWTNGYGISGLPSVGISETLSL